MICNKVHFKALVPSSKFRTQTTTTIVTKYMGPNNSNVINGDSNTSGLKFAKLVSLMDSPTQT